MSNDLSVGVGGELVSLGCQLMLQFKVVLDDAVVNHYDPPGAIPMRVGILFSRSPVGRPARVAEPVIAVDWLGGDCRLELTQLAGTAADLDRAVMNKRDASRVVAAVLQSP